MTKSELYNSTLSLYKKTGQGAPIFILSKFKSEMDQLISEGLIKVVTTPYSYLPDDVTYCITGAYCTEEENQINPFALIYVRLFLGINADLPGGFKVEKDEKYYEWYEENKEKLELIKDLPCYEGSDSDEEVVIEEDQEVIDFLKNSNKYKGNSKINNIIQDFDQMCFLNKQIADLCRAGLKKENGEKFKDKLKDAVNEELMLRKSIKFLENFDREKRIQEII